MPPKARISKEMILDTVLGLTREDGFDTVNARRIADRMNCSTQPIFTCYENMEELKRDFLEFAFDFYQQYVADYEKSSWVEPYLILPLSYLQFTREETFLFRLLFISDMDLRMAQPKDFYREVGNEKKAQVFSEQLGVRLEDGKEIFLDLFLYTHGMAVLTATGKLFLEENSQEKMVRGLLSALVKEKEKA